MSSAMLMVTPITTGVESLPVALSVPADMTTELVLTGDTLLLLLAVVLGTVTTLVAVVDVLLLVIVLGPVTVPVVEVVVVDALEVLVVVELLLVLGTVVVCVGAGGGCTDRQLPEERGEGQVSGTSAIISLYGSYLE